MPVKCSPGRYVSFLLRLCACVIVAILCWSSKTVEESIISDNMENTFEISDIAHRQIQPESLCKTSVLIALEMSILRYHVNYIKMKR